MEHSNASGNLNIKKRYINHEVDSPNKKIKIYGDQFMVQEPPKHPSTNKNKRKSSDTDPNGAKKQPRKINPINPINPDDQPPNNQPPTMFPSITNRKRFNSDDDIINLIVNNKQPTSDNSNNNNKNCSNPLCDHKDYTKDELAQNTTMQQLPVREIKNVDDLIEIGKTYHCKKNKIYHGINLRILCNLVNPLTQLKNLVGMKKVKENIVNQIVFFLQGFNQKEKCNNCIDCTYGLPCSSNLNNDMLHTVITGPPGVGKTELGKILGQVYKAMGILSKGQMHIASRSDLIGKYLGHTAVKTQEFIDKCIGGVMFIDEAYALGNAEGRDSFSKECIDTINQNLTEKRNFLCIIAGYAEQLDKCFFAYNEGLKRRFTFRYDIDNYTSEELAEIFFIKVHNEGWTMECDNQVITSNNNNTNNSGDGQIKIRKVSNVVDKAKFIEFFKKNKGYFPHFGGDIETLFLNCKIYHGRRVLFQDVSQQKVITYEDLGKGYNIYVTNRKYKDTEAKNLRIYSSNK